MAKKGILLMVGTAKGLFILRDTGGKWSIDGPYFPGLAVYSAFLDQRQGRNTMWAAPASWHFGAELCKSTAMGKTWDMPEKRRIKMPTATKKSLENIWQITAGGKDDTLYVGVAPAALFESHDNGETWKLNSGLWKHPHRKQWQPGFGGLCLHTIVTDPNKGVSAYFMPNNYPEFGQCVHKIARHPTDKKLFFLQNHHGVYRSRNGGRTWQEIENGLPSNFGFGLTVSLRDRSLSCLCRPTASGSHATANSASIVAATKANRGSR